MTWYFTQSAQYSVAENFLRMTMENPWCMDPERAIIPATEWYNGSGEYTTSSGRTPITMVEPPEARMYLEICTTTTSVRARSKSLKGAMVGSSSVKKKKKRPMYESISAFFYRLPAQVYGNVALAPFSDLTWSA